MKCLRSVLSAVIMVQIELDVILKFDDYRYNKTYTGQNVSRSPKKKAKKSTKQQLPPLVIILEDFEGFPSHILQDFFLNLIEYSKDIPVTLVLGVATTITVIHQR